MCPVEGSGDSSPSDLSFAQVLSQAPYPPKSPNAMSSHCKRSHSRSPSNL